MAATVVARVRSHPIPRMYNDRLSVRAMVRAVTQSLAALETSIAEDASLRAIRAEIERRAREAADGDAAHDLGHLLRVALWTMRLGEADGVDPRLAIAAALLHDVVNVPKSSPDRTRASAMCAEVARELLPRHGFTPDEVELVSGAVLDHSYSRGATPRTPLGCALQDADRLEALGAIGLMRCISTGSRMSSRYFDDADPFAEARPLDDVRYSIDHFYTKLLGLPATMRTEAGRREAERRAAFLRAFLSELAHELGRPQGSLGSR